MYRIAYYRVSTQDQSIEAQRHAMGGTFDLEFSDEGYSGGVPARLRPGFKELLMKVRTGDTVCVHAVDRLGRDAIDVLSTVRSLINEGVTVDVFGLGPISPDNQIALAIFAQVAEMELRRMRHRQEAGRAAARASLAATGKTHRGKESLGRPFACDPQEVKAWRKRHNASILQTARHFKVSEGTVKRYCALTETMDLPNIL